MSKKIIIGFLLSAVILAGCGGAINNGANYDEFAKCLTDEGMAFYGAFWCGHCADQKQMFGTSMDYINYVECDPRGENGQPEVCLDEEVEMYPTWKHTDGRSWTGVQSFEKLGEITGCEVPADAPTE